jgi:transposase
VHLLCDGLGYPLCFCLSPANENDIAFAPALLEGRRFEALIADRGYDSDALRNLLRSQGCEPIIPGRKSRLQPVAYDQHRFKARHLIENTFQRLKQYRRLATRYEKTDRMLGALLTIGCFLFWLRF